MASKKLHVITDWLQVGVLGCYCPFSLKDVLAKLGYFIFQLGDFFI